MKATFFSLAALAVSAVYAAPTDKRQVGNAVSAVDNVVSGGLGLGQVGDLIGGAGGAGNVGSIADTGALVQLLESLLGNLQGSTGALNSTVGQVQDGGLSKEDAQAKALPELQNIQFQLTEVVTSITTAAGLTVREGDVNRVLGLVVALVSEVLFTVNLLVTVLGITPQLNLLLASVFSLLTGVLAALIGILGTLLPGLIAALSPLLAGLGNGLLAPLLTPIVGLVAAIAPPLPA